MNRKGKLTAWILTAALMIMMLSGCSQAVGTSAPTPTPVPENATELAANVAAALAEVTSVEYRTVVEMNTTMDMGGFAEEETEEAEPISTEMNIKVDSTVQAQADPARAYTSGKTDVDVFGETNSQDIEAYAEEKDGKYVAYSAQGDGTWARTESEKSELDDIYNLSMYEAIRDGNIEAVLAADKVDIEGTPAYKLDVELDGSEIVEYLGTALDNLTSVIGEDYEAALSDASVRLVLYVSDETSLPIRMEFDGTEIGNRIMSYVQSFITVTVSSFTVVAEYSKYNEIPEITIPEEVVANAVEAEDTESDDLTDGETLEYSFPEADDDGRYRVSSDLAMITAAIGIPEGQAVSDGGASYLFTSGVSEDPPYSQYIFYFIDDMTEAEIEELALTTEWMGDVDPADISESQVSEKTTIDVNGMQVYYALKSCVMSAGTENQSYSSEVNAWTVLDGTIFLVSFDYYTAGDSTSDDEIDYEALIRTAFENVTFE